MKQIKRLKVSQQDIARDLGVSQALVSMALNGQGKGIHEETFRRIREHARSVGYRPRGERRGPGAEMTQVGFILRPGHTLYNQSSFYSHLQHSLHGFLEKEGLQTVFLGSEPAVAEGGFRKLARLQGELLGIVVMGEVSVDFLRALKGYFPRLVAVAASFPGYCHSVLNNEARMLDLLVEHLAKLGHHSFAWLGGNAESRLLARRFEALQQAMERRGLSLPLEHARQRETSQQRDGQEGARELLETFGRKRLPTAWIAYNGRMARGAINFLLARQVEVPGEVSVVACDGTYICEDEEPTITGAYADPACIGAIAGELLLKATGEPDEAYTEIILPASLTTRQSSGRAGRR